MDTNGCIEILRGRNPSLKQRLETAGFDQLRLCSIVWAELHCGACLLANPEQEKRRIEAAFAGWPRLPFDDAAAECYGEIRARLQGAGRMIGANDLLIAATALANGLTLITHNTDEFKRVEGLAVEDWEEESRSRE
ncbi:MAG: type II toxin-antitoxin system VapC family toxin [Chromatiaceae bacterium]